MSDFLGAFIDEYGWQSEPPLRVVRVRDDDADQPPVLVVEDVAG